MKRLYVFLILLVIVFSGCSVQEKKADSKDVVFVSILPQQYIVQQLAGEAFTVEVMMPPGSSPHIYEPSPAQIRKLSMAKAYIRMGQIGFEKVWMDKLSAANSKMIVFDQSQGVSFIENECNHDHQAETHAEHNHGIVDPHIWLSTVEMNVQAENITRFLTELLPDSAQYFQSNLSKFKSTLALTDKKIQDLLRDTKRKEFMIYHPALAYFARDYNLKQLTLEFEGKEPSGKYMAELIGVIKEKGIRTIFIQREFPVERAEVLAKELNAAVEVLDPLEYNWTSNMIRMAGKIQKALNE